MNVLGTAAALLPLAAGMAAFDAALRGSTRAERVAGLCLGAGLGVGVGSCLFFAWSLAFGPSSPGLVWIDLALLAIALWIRRRRGSTATRAAAATVSLGPHQSALAVALAIAAGATAIGFGVASAAAPHGSWDAWAIWNMHARWIARGGEDWLGFLRLEYGQPSYPLLTPLTVARLWLASGVESQGFPIAVAAFFTLASAGLLVSALAAFRGLGVGLLGGIVLCSSPTFLGGSVAQHADVPFAFFALATAVLLYRGLGAEQRALCFALAGASAGLAAWTKDEGWLLLLLAITVAGVCELWQRGARSTARCVAWLAIGSAPVVLVVAAFKAFLAPPGWLASGVGGGSLVGHLGDPARAGQIAAAFLRRGVEQSRLFDTAGPWLNWYALLALYPWLTEARPRLRRDPAALAVVALGGAMLAGYAAVFLVTPRDLKWQLASSLPRLLLHAWPILVFGWLLLVPSPVPEREEGRSPP